MKRFALPLIGVGLLGFVLMRSAAPLQATVATNTSSSSSSSSQDAGDKCTADIDKALRRERFLFETMLLGNRHAAEEGPRATRVDEDGNTWIKNTDGKWVTSGKDTITDEEMDGKTAKDPLAKTEDVDPKDAAIRPGILETQKALTSDLIPPVLQGFRAFQCRLESLCAGVDQSANTPASSASSSSMSVIIPGCQPVEEKLIASCQPSAIFTINDTVAARTYCRPVMKELTSYEESQLLFLTHEDAAQRTLRQFAGFLEPLLVKLRFPFLSPLQQVSNFIGEWSSVSCFLPYCAP